MLEARTKIQPVLIQSNGLKELGWGQESEVAVHVHAFRDSLEQFLKGHMTLKVPLWKG